MSRIGNMPIEIPDKVQVKIENNTLLAKGPKGELSLNIVEEITPKLDGKTLLFDRINESKKVKSLHGLSRALAWNLIEGVNNGFSKTLLIEGIGYKAEVNGKLLVLSLGYSHPIVIFPPEDVNFEVEKNTTITISGIDKQLVGQISAKIRKLRPPEPYKGKGIRYKGEYIRRKAGKTAAK